MEEKEGSVNRFPVLQLGSATGDKVTGYRASSAVSEGRTISGCPSENDRTVTASHFFTVKLPSPPL